MRFRNDARLSLAAFLALQPLALYLYLAIGRTQWFLFDEWDFLGARTAGSANDLFRPHLGHWCTLPILAYRLMWNIFGVGSYRPYLALIVVLHLVVAGLLRVVMRRAGVSPWLATGAAGAYVFFGPGWHNIEEAFQITFVGALIFGLSHLLLADHDGRIDWRDWLGLGAGLCGLMCSGVGVTMVIVVGAAVFLRRGRRVAAFHVVPLAATYAVWSRTVHGTPRHQASLGQFTHFVWDNVRAVFDALGGGPMLGVVLAVVLVLGLVLGRRDPLDVRKRHATVRALLFGAVTFVALTAITRAGIPDNNRAFSRYVDVMCALMLPALAVAAETLAARWRLIPAVVIGILVLGSLLSFHVLTDKVDFWAPYHRVSKLTMTAIPRLPVAKELPPSILADRERAYVWVTVGWLRGAAASGRLPEPGPIPPVTAATLTLRLSTQRVAAGRAADPCARLTRPISRRLRPGDWIAVSGPGAIRVRHEASREIVLDASHGLQALVSIRLEIRPAPPRTSVTLCAGHRP